MLNWALEREWVKGRNICWKVGGGKERNIRQREKQRRENLEGAIFRGKTEGSVSSLLFLQGEDREGGWGEK